MDFTRRDFVRQAAGSAVLAGVLARSALASDEDFPAIVDTHQHLWDLSHQRLPWLENAEPVLRKSYTTEDYREATRGLNVTRAIYMEVDVAPEQHVAEAEHVLTLCRDPEVPTVAAVIGGRPADPAFGAYLARFLDHPSVKGVRQVLHGPTTPAGYCLEPEFVRGIRLLGDKGLRFDLCMRPTELKDGITLTERCPETRFVVDHCGNADVKAFRPGATSGHDPVAWKRDMEGLARRPNTICKISGIVASAPEGWTADDLAPIVNHCLDVFGPDRVVFGGDWPVCLLGAASYRQWVEALREVVAGRSRTEQEKLWNENATRFYALKD